MTTKKKVIKFLNAQRDLFAYQQTAMSQADFSRFISELLEVLDEDTP